MTLELHTRVEVISVNNLTVTERQKHRSTCQKWEKKKSRLKRIISYLSIQFINYVKCTQTNTSIANSPDTSFKYSYLKLCWYTKHLLPFGFSPQPSAHEWLVIPEWYHGDYSVGRFLFTNTDISGQKSTDCQCFPARCPRCSCGWVHTLSLSLTHTAHHPVTHRALTHI